ncbi:MAG: glutamate--tRNA ligase [Planctomycetes bacterium]|nr:glutamate--tRNA ligase [Planctomycetota bacterium]
MTSRPVRVRFAPSPTGPLHVGGARTALYNFLYARATGGTFVLRIDDTDRARSTDESLQNILDGMRWLGLDWDEGPTRPGETESASRFGPYFQSLKFDRYREVVLDLRERGRAYPCFATAEEVEEGRQAMARETGVPMYDRRYRTLPRDEADARIAAGEPHVWRFATPLASDGGESKVVVHDAIKGDVEVDLKQIDDWVMLRNDGTPLYNLCSTIDDLDMGITDVVRGEEHFVNAVKQILLFRALEADVPRFAHLPLILGKDGKKLSKRVAQTNLLDYRDQGYPPEAIVNFLTLLGWSFDGEREIFSLAEAVDAFSIDKLGRSGSVFDEDKMIWMCGMYVRATPVEVLVDRVAPFLEAEGVLSKSAIAESRAYVENVVSCHRERFDRYGEVPSKIAFLFADSVEYDAKALKSLRKSPETADWLLAFRDALKDVAVPPSWPDRPPEADALRLPETGDATTSGCGGASSFARPSELEAMARALADRLGIGFGNLVAPLRAALTGAAGGAGLFDIVYLLGRERCVARIDAAIDSLRS